MTLVTRPGRSLLARASALALTLVLTGAVAADAQTSAYGHTAAPDRALRPGCHDYAYRYVIKAPTDDWTLETFLDDPRGETLGSGAFLSDSDPRRGDGVFRFCRYSTKPGRFTIRAKVQWYDGSQEHRAWFEPSHFRLRRAG
jgi:hypothetical protein